MCHECVSGGRSAANRSEVSTTHKRKVHDVAATMTVVSFNFPPSSSSVQAMLADTVQSGLLSLFSSTGSDPLQLFSQHADKDLPEDSFIHLLEDTTNDPAPSPPRKLMHSALKAEDGHCSARRRTLCQTVLHIQSPTIRSTFVRCPGWSGGSKRSVLGMKHPWIHLQVRNLDHDWAFEVGVIDNMKTRGIIRFSTFQVNIYFLF